MLLACSLYIGIAGGVQRRWIFPDQSFANAFADSGIVHGRHLVCDRLRDLGGGWGSDKADVYQWGACGQYLRAYALKRVCRGRHL